jgi:hypothetical protein
MPNNGAPDASQITQYNDFAFLAVLAVLLLGGAVALRAALKHVLDEVNRNNRRQFFEAGCSYFLVTIVGDVQMLNIGLYILWESGPAKITRILTANIPTKTNELVMLICYLLFIPLTVRWLKDR